MSDETPQDFHGNDPDAMRGLWSVAAKALDDLREFKAEILAVRAIAEENRRRLIEGNKAFDRIRTTLYGQKEGLVAQVDRLKTAQESVKDDVKAIKEIFARLMWVIILAFLGAVLTLILRTGSPASGIEDIIAEHPALVSQPR